MKNFYYKTLVVALVLVGIIGIASAAPFVDPKTGNNGGVNPPIHTGLDQVKDASLSVGNFIANSVAVFKQNVFFSSPILGAPLESPRKDGTTPKTVGFGGVKIITQADPVLGVEEESEQYKTSIVVSNMVRASKALFSGNLFHNFAKPAETCADKDGNVVKCDNPNDDGDDICPNIDGKQPELPTTSRTLKDADGKDVVIKAAMYLDDDGNCQFPKSIPTAEDWCPNIPGNQTTWPQWQKNPDGTGKPIDIADFYAYDVASTQALLTTFNQEVQRDMQTILSTTPTDAPNFGARMGQINNLSSKITSTNNAIGSAPANVMPGSQAYTALESLVVYIGNESNTNQLPSQMVDRYKGYATTIAGIYNRDATNLRPMSWNSSYDCEPRPVLTKVEWYEIVTVPESSCNKGNCSAYIADQTLKFTFDYPALEDQDIGVRGINVGSGTDVGPTAYMKVREGDTTASFTLVGQSRPYSGPKLAVGTKRSANVLKKFSDDNRARGGRGGDYDFGAWNSGSTTTTSPDAYCIAGSRFRDLVANKPNSSVVIPKSFRYWSTFENFMFKTLGGATLDTSEYLTDTDCIFGNGTVLTNDMRGFNDNTSTQTYLGFQKYQGTENPDWDGDY